MKKFAILTSGGDAPGMNAAIYGAAKVCQELSIELIGYIDGYEGMIDNHFVIVTEATARKHLSKGGTFLGTARSERFRDANVRRGVVERMASDGIEGIIIIGGDGSFNGALLLEELGLKVIAIPGTIDNDIPRTERTLGFKTAIRNVVDTVDIIMQSAISHRHIYGIEVMGRRAGDIAFWTAEALGADGVVVHLEEFDPNQIVEIIDQSIARGNRAQLFMIAEGAMTCHEFKEAIEAHSNHSIHPLMLGHIQRGGDPVPDDRILGQKFGSLGANLLIDGHSGKNLAVVNNTVVSQNIKETLSHDKTDILPFSVLS